MNPGGDVTNGAVVEGPKRKWLSRPFAPVIAFVAVLVIGWLFRWASDTTPRPEFWPFIIALAIALAIFTYFRPLPYLSYNDKPVEPVGTALFWAVVWGVVEGGVFWILYSLAWSNGRYWGIALMMAILGGMNRYYHGRHLKRRHFAQFLAIALVLALMVVVKLLGRR
jgi:uncharacterized membrane protein YjjP (DUF1212 family)